MNTEYQDDFGALARICTVEEMFKSPNFAYPPTKA